MWGFEIWGEGIKGLVSHQQSLCLYDNARLEIYTLVKGASDTLG